MEDVPDNQWGGCIDQGNNVSFRIIRRLIFIYIPVFGSLATYFAIVIKILHYRQHNLKRNLPHVNQTQLYSTISLFVRILLCSVTVTPFWFDVSDMKGDTSQAVILWIKFLFQFSYSLNPVNII